MAVILFIAVTACDQANPVSTTEATHTAAQQSSAAHNNGFADQQRCLQCHVQQAADWRDSHHDLAMAVANENSVLGNFNDQLFTHRGSSSRFHRSEGRYFVNTEGKDGQLQDFEIKYTFGVQPLQQYLVEFPDGRLQALSVAWDSRPATRGGQRWFQLQADV